MVVRSPLIVLEAFEVHPNELRFHPIRLVLASPEREKCTPEVGCVECQDKVDRVDEFLRVLIAKQLPKCEVLANIVVVVSHREFLGLSDCQPIEELLGRFRLNLFCASAKIVLLDGFAAILAHPARLVHFGERIEDKDVEQLRPDGHELPAIRDGERISRHVPVVAFKLR